MVNYLREFQEALEDFLDLTVFFNENEIRYKFQGFWTSSHFEKDIQDKAKKLENLLFRQLQNGLNNKTLLLEVKTKMRDAYNFLYDVYYDDFDNLTKSNLIARYSSASPESSSDPYTYEFFEHLISNDKARKELQKGNIEFTMLFDSLLKLFESFERNDKTPSRLQFENAKLLDCIYCYREILFDLLDTVEHYFYNIDKVDFSKIDIVNFSENDIIDFDDADPIIEKVKCKINLSKIEVARFFKFLMIEKYLYFDLSDRSKNKMQLQDFIESNFSYQLPNKKQGAIKNIKREFAETHIEIKENYNRLIDDLIKILETKRKP
ncbi:MAG: hypothetical protein M0D53_01020 [Flavobacterium sp. JAD_PAG50586_2]|nr:MAG: hypothetical protein M0D53_01020 [Flavobacterium sp. JAD_PAG50586_2]